MLDIAAAYNKFAFLGYEFLTWLWYLIEKDRPLLSQIDEELTGLDIGNRLVLENRAFENVENITIKGDDAGLEEGILALRKGAIVVEMNLVYRSGDHEWRFTIKGESFHLANLKSPETAPIETQDDREGVILEKIFLYEKAFQGVDRLYGYFIKQRISSDWNDTVLPKIKKWIEA